MDNLSETAGIEAAESSMGKRRLFVAVKISKRLESIILDWEKELLSGPLFGGAGAENIRWLDGKNLHITLVPPWYETELSPAASALKKNSERIRPFEIEFRNVGYGPAPRRPRLIWASGRTPNELRKLKAQAEKILGKQQEARPFLLHLTLARFRPEDFSQFKTKTLDENVSWRDEVGSIVLMESRLSPPGADYEVLEEFKF